MTVWPVRLAVARSERRWIPVPATRSALKDWRKLSARQSQRLKPIRIRVSGVICDWEKDVLHYFHLNISNNNWQSNRYMCKTPSQKHKQVEVSSEAYKSITYAPDIIKFMRFVSTSYYNLLLSLQPNKKNQIQILCRSWGSTLCLLSVEPGIPWLIHSFLLAIFMI